MIVIPSDNLRGAFEDRVLGLPVASIIGVRVIPNFVSLVVFIRFQLNARLSLVSVPCSCCAVITEGLVFSTRLSVACFRRIIDFDKMKA